MEIEKNIIFIIFIIINILSFIYLYFIIKFIKDDIENILKIMISKDSEYEKRMKNITDDYHKKMQIRESDYGEKWDKVYDDFADSTNSTFDYLEKKADEIEKSSLKTLDLIKKETSMYYTRFTKTEKKLNTLKKEDIEIYDMLINLLEKEDIEKNKFSIFKIKDKKEKFEKDLKK